MRKAAFIQDAKRLVATLALGLAAALGGELTLRAQMYTGIEGLLHTPSAQMSSRGSGRVGVHHLSRNFIPASFAQDAHAYYLAYNPLDWAEISFTGVVRKTGGIVYQDRMCSFKLRPLAEGKWYPAVVLGCNDPLSTVRSGPDDESNNRFANFYVAATKTFPLAGELGVHLAYRYFIKNSNDALRGIVGGLTWRPFFAPMLRATAEWDGREVNCGLDAKLFNFLCLQAVLQDWKYLSLGICFEINHL